MKRGCVLKGSGIQLLILISISFLVTQRSYSQVDTRPLDGGVKSSKADEIYNKKGYKASILEFLKMDNISDTDKLKIANAYRLNHETEDAELWYEQVLGLPNSGDLDPTHYLHFAQVLQSNGKEQEAAKYYDIYAESLKNNDHWDKIARIFSKNVTLTGRFPHTDLILKNEKFINTKKLEFSPAIFDNGIVYVTTQQSNKLPKSGKDPWLNENYMSLMTAKKGEDNLLVQPKVFSTELTSVYHEGPVSFSNNNTRIYFTMNHKDGKRNKLKSNVRKLQIYSSKWNGRKWEEPELLNFNTEEHEEAHPALSPDGNTMYFASDRPGGLGGMDLYMSTKENGRWSKPKNLGKEINTPGNEVFPFYHANGMLFFSSNGHDGLGGLDIFHSSISFNGKWAKAVNAGTPFNSIKDDFGLILELEGKIGYLTSAREGGIGKDDIYSFVLEDKILEPKKVAICVQDQKTGQMLGNTGIKVFSFESRFALNSKGFGEDKNFHIRPTENGDEFLLVLETDDISREPIAYYTNDEGILDFEVLPGINYKFVAEKPGYKLGQYNISYEDESLGQKDHCIILEEGSSEIPEVPQLNTNSGKKLNVNEISKTNEDFVNISKKELERLRNAEKKSTDDTPRPNKIDNKESVVNAPVTPKSNLETITESNTENRLSISNADLALSELGKENLKVGKVLVLENIYYDFDKYYIRPDAEKELDKVVDLMNQYPKMIIELSSHTDSRGSDRYNEKLSSQRARSAVDYIAESGIDIEKLISKGYGEEKLRNSCRDGRTCSEKDHQYNRRTEIKILHFPYEDVDISVADNKPIIVNKKSQAEDASQTSRDNKSDIQAMQIHSSTAYKGNAEYRVYAGSYSKRSGALKKLKKINESGFNASILEFEDLNLFRIIAGEFNSRDEANQMVDLLRSVGVKAMVKTLDD